MTDTVNPISRFRVMRLDECMVTNLPSKTIPPASLGGEEQEISPLNKYNINK